MREQRGSLTNTGSSLNLAQSCPFQFTHLQNGNNNKHLRENIHMSSLRPLIFISPEAQQRETVRFRCFEWASNGACSSYGSQEDQVLSSSTPPSGRGDMPEARHCEHPLSWLILRPLPCSASHWWSNIWLTQWFSTSAKWSGLWDEQHAEPQWSEKMSISTALCACWTQWRPYKLSIWPVISIH